MNLLFFMCFSSFLKITEHCSSSWLLVWTFSERISEQITWTGLVFTVAEIQHNRRHTEWAQAEYLLCWCGVPWGCSGSRVAGGREVNNAGQKHFSVGAKKWIFKHTTSIGKVKVLSMKIMFMKKNSQCYHTFGNTCTQFSLHARTSAIHRHC